MPVLCPLCERECPSRIMSDHHLRTRGADPHLTVLLCRDCHRAIHRLFHNRELAATGSRLATIPGLKDHPDMARHLAFVSKQDPNRRWSMKTSNRKSRR